MQGCGVCAGGMSSSIRVKHADHGTTYAVQYGKSWPLFKHFVLNNVVVAIKHGLGGGEDWLNGRATARRRMI